MRSHTTATLDANATARGLAFSRRSLLRAGGLTTLATMLGGLTSLTSAVPAHAAPSTPTSTPVHPKPTATPRAGV